jgi:hypothetical protein
MTARLKVRRESEEWFVYEINGEYQVTPISLRDWLDEAAPDCLAGLSVDIHEQRTDNTYTGGTRP